MVFGGSWRLLRGSFRFQRVPADVGGPGVSWGALGGLRASCLVSRVQSVRLFVVYGVRCVGAVRFVRVVHRVPA
eukprot:11233672-Alexandrium_andersonii.AAC.1